MSVCLSSHLSVCVSVCLAACLFGTYSISYIVCHFYSWTFKKKIYQLECNRWWITNTARKETHMTSINHRNTYAPLIDATYTVWRSPKICFRALVCGVNANYERIVSWSGDQFRNGHPRISKMPLATHSVMNYPSNGLAPAEWHHWSQQRVHMGKNNSSLGCLILALTHRYHFARRRNTHIHISTHILYMYIYTTGIVTESLESTIHNFFPVIYVYIYISVWNMMTTKFLVSDDGHDVLKKSTKYPCVVCCCGVGMCSVSRPV